MIVMSLTSTKINWYNNNLLQIIISLWKTDLIRMNGDLVNGVPAIQHERVAILDAGAQYGKVGRRASDIFQLYEVMA